MFVKLAVIILAVTCGVSMFAYLHNRRKVDFLSQPADFRAAACSR